MKVQLVAKPGAGMTGTSRYTQNLYRGLHAAGVDVSLTLPELFPPWVVARRALRRMGMDARAFFGSYPMRIHRNCADVYHLTTQTMGTLLLTQRFDRPVVVTVLDIIPYLVRKNPELRTFRNPIDALFYRLALLGLRRADAISAISHWTKQTLVDALGLPPDKIHVIYPAVDHTHYRPADTPDAFRKRYRLAPGPRYVLYVGSNDPRKNIATLFQAVRLLCQERQDVELIALGAEAHPGRDQVLLDLTRRLGLQARVQFFNQIPEGDLPLFYNAAAVCVVPSHYEGFGLPALEALACGVPLVCSRAASLPEVVGAAALLVDPRNVGAMAWAIAEVLDNKALARHLRREGPAQAARFRWSITSNLTKDIYDELFTRSSQATLSVPP